ncbi:MAG: conjugal transfer protein, partial [Anaerolineae bacterium]|nr:conjugal transfer protein [Anaerolineae bacterium]
MKKPEESPYLSAHQAYLEKNGNILQAAYQWRMAFFICAAILLVVSGGLVTVSLQHKAVPFLVEFNEHSEVVRVSRAEEMTQPNVKHIKSALNNWMKGARTVYGDRRAQEHMIDVTFAMTLPDSSASQMLGGYQTENNPYARSQKEAVDVSVNEVMFISGNTWRIEWTETTKQLSGRV